MIIRATLGALRTTPGVIEIGERGLFISSMSHIESRNACSSSLYANELYHMNFYDAIFEPTPMHRPPPCPPKAPLNFAGMGYSQRGAGECVGISLPQLQFSAPMNSRGSHFAPSFTYPQTLTKRAGCMPSLVDYTSRLSVSEDLIRTHTIEILSQAQHGTLKSVELANALRDRIAAEHFNEIKKTHGGLLSLLQRFPGVFRVDRIPKNDRVTLLTAHAPSSKSVAPPSATPRSSVLPISKPISSSPPTSTSSCCVYIEDVVPEVTEHVLLRECGGSPPVATLSISLTHGRRYATIEFVSPQMAQVAYRNIKHRGWIGGHVAMKPFSPSTVSHNEDMTTLPDEASCSLFDHSPLNGAFAAHVVSAPEPIGKKPDDADDSPRSPASLFIGGLSISPPNAGISPITAVSSAPSVAASGTTIDPVAMEKVLAQLCDSMFVPSSNWKSLASESPSPGDIYLAEAHYVAVIQDIISDSWGCVLITNLKARFKKRLGLGGGVSIRVGPLRAFLKYHTKHFRIIDDKYVQLVTQPALLGSNLGCCI